MRFKHACVFVDGENLRHSLLELLEGDFAEEDYLPRKADWTGFFDRLVNEAGAESRLRSYWYVVESIEFWPYRLPLHDADAATLESVLKNHKPFKTELERIADERPRRERCLTLAKPLLERLRIVRNRFDGWKEIQDGIMLRSEAVEFRRKGWVPYDLFLDRMRQEKAVDVKLATDMLELRPYYEVAIIVSGDGDYVPAVERLKDSGKHVVNVAFLKRGGGLLPGGARKLNVVVDGKIEMDYETVRKQMGFGA